MLRPSVSLVLPAWNEAAGIRQAVLEADEALTRLNADYEIIVVDDGSQDDTAAIVAEEATRHPRVRLVRHQTNRGYGAALRTGFAAAQGDYVAFTDADCQFFLEDLALMLPLAQSHPVVVGYRVDRQDPWRRKVLSRGYNLLARTLLGTVVRDIDCALKVFQREALQALLPESHGFFVNTEMLTRARQQGFAIAEVGVRHRPRVRGCSTVSWREVPRTLGQLLPFWWTRASFAGERRSQEGKGWETILGSLLVVVVAVVLFFTSLRAPLLEPQEARYAEIARQMLAADRWIVPVLHGQDYLDKPPLFYWALMQSYRWFGIHDWAARLIPGLAGVGCVLITLLWGRRMFGPRGGVCAAAVLCLMPEFLYRCRMLTFDGLLALWTTGALAAAWRGLESSRLRWGWWFVSAGCCGLGLLTKGPVALALVVVPVGLLVWLDTRRARLGWHAVAAYLGISLVVALPWYVLVMMHRPEFAYYFFWKHNIVRYVAPFDHAKPWWFYLPQLMMGLAPWLLLIPLLLWHLSRRPMRAAARRPAGLGFALLCFTWMLVFFSLAGCKRPVYLVPAMPPVALALGWLVARYAPSLLRGSVPAEWVAVSGLSVGLVVVAAGWATQLIRNEVAMWMMAACLLGLTLVFARKGRLAWGETFALMAVACYVAVAQLLPAYHAEFSVRGDLRRYARAGQTLVCYPTRFDSTSFYLPNHRVQVFSRGQQRELAAHLEATPEHLLLIKSPALQEVMRYLPDREFVGSRNGAISVGRLLPVTRVTSVTSGR
ncbi:MAG: glycosyltransferase [Gemmataceae bacterium]